jgi:hypothetical protein
MEVGHLVNNKKDLEFRYFDTDGDGYLDTTQVFEGANPIPVRVSHVTDLRTRPVTLTRDWLQADYNNKVLPSAIREDEQLIAVLKAAVQNPLAAAYEDAATKAETLERRRYCLDIARELYFLKARDAFYTRTAAGPYPKLDPAPKSMRIMAAGPVDGGFTLGDSVVYWQRSKQIEQFVQSYGAGKIDDATSAAKELAKSLP